MTLALPPCGALKLTCDLTHLLIARCLFRYTFVFSASYFGFAPSAQPWALDLDGKLKAPPPVASIVLWDLRLRRRRVRTRTATYRRRRSSAKTARFGGLSSLPE